MASSSLDLVLLVDAFPFFLDLEESRFGLAGVGAGWLKLSCLS